ncbi:hypothetical protein K439DRAFT_1623077 [Ramaria rubella]|nr:hypothetical protein K439DRAFT_1623077 [Ramaria rubella]
MPQMSLQDARKAIYAFEEARGNKMHTGQSKRVSKAVGSAPKKVTYRCSCYAVHNPKHKADIDPSDHRNGRSIQTNCMAHVNVNQILPSNQWRITAANWTHNHDRVLAPGAHAPHPPHPEQRAMVAKYAQFGNFSQDHLKKIMAQEFPEHILEDRQISNILNMARTEGRAEVSRLGGDIATVIAHLDFKIADGEGWRYKLQLDDSRVVGLWWQSPEQAQLAMRYSGILINDNSHNHNQYGYPLNIGIVIDSFEHSRNIWYCFQEREDADSHRWVLRNHLETAGQPPEVFVSDRDAASRVVAADVTPTAYHLFCLHHLTGNVDDYLRPILGSEFQAFTTQFCDLLTKYPHTRPYLEAHLYPDREHWAWAWVSQVFTAGIRTNGRVESENRIHKAFGGPKVPLAQLFDQLNAWTDEQTAHEKVRVREATRRHHATNLESLFARPLTLLQEYAGPFALQTAYREMTQSLFYHTEVLQRPEGLRTWEEMDYEWEAGEEKVVDSSSHCTRPVGLYISHLLRVLHKSTGATHIVALLEPRLYMFATAAWVPILRYHADISSIWLQNPRIDIQFIPPVTLTHEVPEQRLSLRSNPLPTSLISNPLHHSLMNSTPAPQTQTLPSHAVYAEAHVHLKPLLRRVQTRKQLDQLVEDLQTVQATQEQRLHPSPPFHNPPIIQQKGHPCIAHLTSAREGVRRGGGPHKRPKLPSSHPVEHAVNERNPLSTSPPRKRRAVPTCSPCHLPGHNRLQHYEFTVNTRDMNAREKREKGRQNRVD